VFGLGLLISQFVKNSRTAAGATVIIVTTLYVLNNIAEKYSWLEPIKYFSPFYYANLSRPVIPGFSSNYTSWIVTSLVGIVLIGVSVQLFNVRDIGGTVFSEKVDEQDLKTRFVPKGLIGDMLWRQRVGVAAWVIASSAFIGVFISLMSGIIDIWAKFAFLEQFAASGFGETPELQYLAMVYEILPPFIAGFVIQQSGRWTSDLNEGRVQLILSTGISRNALIGKRLVATLLGALIMITSTMIVATIGSIWQNANLYPAALGRVFVMTILFAVAFAAINAALVAILHGKNAVQLLSIYVGAAWLIGFMAPYLNWPTWLVRLSIFDAFGHPFVQWPTLLNFVTIIGAMCLSFVTAVVVSQQKPVVK
jgi:ABC-2 type transport system permease protein